MNESSSERAATDAQIRQHPAFTRGPWHVERRRCRVEIHTESTAGLTGASLAAVHSQRLNNNYPSPAKADHPQMANAYVMAAAPAMYDLLGDIEKFLGDLTEGYDLYERCGIVRAQARGEVATQ